MKAKRTYKDSLFRDIFNNKRRLQQIYEALTGKHISLSDITITTLRGTFFEDIKNDISFMAGNQHIILMEHQSTLSRKICHCVCYGILPSSTGRELIQMLPTRKTV